MCPANQQWQSPLNTKQLHSGNSSPAKLTHQLHSTVHPRHLQVYSSSNIIGSNHLPGGWLPTTQHAMPSHEHDFWMWWGQCQKQETSQPKRLNPSQQNTGVHRADLYLRSGCYQVITTAMLRPSQGVISHFIRENTLCRLRLLQNSKAQLPKEFHSPAKPCLQFVGQKQQHPNY